MEFYAIDIETSGLDPAQDEIIEIAWARFTEGEIQGTFHTLVRPARRPPREVLQLTGIPWRELARAPEPEPVLREVLRALDGQVLVAHNAPFDRGFIERAASKIDAPLSAHWVDTLALSRAVWPEEYSHSLKTVRRRLGLSEGDAHRALPDALAAGRLLMAALHRAARFPKGARKALSVYFPPQAEDWLKAAPSSQRQRSSPRSPANDLSEAFGRLEELPAWQDRSSQRSYAATVERTLRDGGTAFLEAGPGTGKTLGYLVPVLLRLAGGKGRTAVATRTRALQEQLWHKDLPLALDKLGLDVGAALLKGRENYLCLRRLEEARGGLWATDMLNTVLAWAERTTTGDLDELAVLWSRPEGRRLLGALRVLPHRCTRRACPFLGRCPSRRARERAREANLIVVNHALLAADAASGGAILGELDALIVDEAHALAGAARDAFTSQVTPATVPALLGELRRGGRGLLTTWAQEVNTDTVLALWQQVRTTHRQVWDTLLPRIPKEAARYGPKLVAGALKPGEALHQALLRLAQELTYLGERAQGETEELAKGIALRAQELAGTWDTLLHPEYEDAVFWHCFEGGMPCLKTSPVELGPLLDEGLWSRVPATILTSATLSGGEGITPLALELGLAPNEEAWESWSSPFPYKDVAACVPRFLPRPDDQTYPRQLGELVKLLASRGGCRTLVLFTSRTMLESTAPHITGVQTLVQGRDGEREQLVRRFRNADPPVVLLGLDTFWEGVDLPGDEVEAVVIARLPFPVPGDPLIRAEAERMRAGGRDPFRLLFLPRAVLRLRQGAGRLVRTPDDRGLLIIADPRTLSEPYGKEFTESLPVPTQGIRTLKELLEKMEQVLRPKRSPPGKPGHRPPEDTAGHEVDH